MFNKNKTYLYLGVECPLIISNDQAKPLYFKDNAFYISSFQYKKINEEVIMLMWYKKAALELFKARVAYVNTTYPFIPKKITLTNAATRWGSCSSLQNIKLSWKLIKAPLDIIDYVVIHELVHLEYLNHSKLFWGRVKELCPTYKLAEHWLKVHGHKLIV